MVLGNEKQPEFNSLNCPVCQYPYSSSDRGSKPYMTSCGHTACGSCIAIYSTCGVCNQSYVPGFKSLNYNLIDVVEEVNKVASVANEGKEFSVKCSKCGDWVKMDRSRICKTCFAGAGDFADDVAPSDDVEIAPYVFCSSCAIDDHIEEKHDVIKYTQWKNRQLMSSATESAYGNVERIVELCKTELQNGRKRLREWNEAVVSAETAGISAQSVKRCKRLAENCERYGETVYDFADMNVLPALRRFTATMETVTANLRADILICESGGDEPASKVHRLADRRVLPPSRNPVVDMDTEGANADLFARAFCEGLAEAAAIAATGAAAANRAAPDQPHPDPSAANVGGAEPAVAAEENDNDMHEWPVNRGFFRRRRTASDLRNPDEEESSESSSSSSDSSENDRSVYSRDFDGLCFM